MENNRVILIQNNGMDSSTTDQLIILNIPSDSPEMNEVEQLLYEWNLYYLRDKFRGNSNHYQLLKGQ